MPEIGQTISDGWFQRARTRNVCARVTPFDLSFAHARGSAYMFYRVSYPFNFSEWKVSRVFSITLKKKMVGIKAVNGFEGIVAFL